jgi:hypothetical protein
MSATSKDLNDDAYYCVAASLAKTFTAGEWELHFCRKQAQQVWMGRDSLTLIVLTTY